MLTQSAPHMVAWLKVRYFSLSVILLHLFRVKVAFIIQHQWGKFFWNIDERKRMSLWLIFIFMTKSWTDTWCNIVMIVIFVSRKNPRVTSKQLATTIHQASTLWFIPYTVGLKENKAYYLRIYRLEETFTSTTLVSGTLWNYT